MIRHVATLIRQGINNRTGAAPMPMMTRHCCTSKERSETASAPAHPLARNPRISSGPAATV
jgi:hypothetical protein